MMGRRALLLLVCFLWLPTLVVGLVIRIRPPSPDQFLTKTLLLPVQVPRLLQDPQNVPRNSNKYFGFFKNGTLVIDLRVVRPLDAEGEVESASSAGASTQVLEPLGRGPKSLLRRLWDTASEAAVKQILFTRDLVCSDVAASWYLSAPRASRQIAAYALFLTSDNNKGARVTPWVRHKYAIPIDDEEEAGLIKDGIRYLLTSSTQWTKRKWLNPQAAGMTNLVAGGDSSARGAPSSKSAADATSDRPLYLFVLSEKQWERVLEELATPSHSVYSEEGLYHVPNKIFSSYIQSALRIPFEEKVRVTFKPRVPSDYMILLLNPNSRPLQLFGTITMTNDGDNHLSYSDRMDGFAVKTAFFLNFSTACILCVLLLTVWREKKTDLHVLAGLIFIVKSLYLLLDWTNVEGFSKRGELETINWILPRMVAKIQDTIVLLFFILVGFGWKIHRRSLTVLETRTVAATCVLSLYLGVFEASTGAFQAFRYIIHSLAFLVVIVLINFNIFFFDVQTENTGLCRETAAFYKRKEAYLTFRVVFILFILKPTLLLLYKLLVLANSDVDDWILVIVDNLIDWSILVSITYAFKPFENMHLFEDLGIRNDTTHSREDEYMDRPTTEDTPPASMEDGAIPLGMG